MRTCITKEEIRDMFPIGTIKKFKKLKCFNRLLDNITYDINKKNSTISIKFETADMLTRLSADDVLLEAFCWENTKEGAEYWNEVYNKLCIPNLTKNY